MKQISLGLDIGVSSVGFSVVESDGNNGKVLELGSRLFSASVGAENQTRRERRGSRRLLRRKKQRRIDSVKLFQKYGLMGDIEGDNYYQEFNKNSNPYKLRVDGLNRKLTMEETLTALYQLVKHRGISFSLDDESKGSEYSKSLIINENELLDKTPAEIQLNRLHSYNKVRGLIKTNEDSDNNDEKQLLLNVFPTTAFEKEARAIITNQRKYYPELTQQFENEYCEILKRKRGYFVGPGRENSRTDYGIYKENGETLDNLFEGLIGHDSVFKEELRASGASYTAQLYNVLNDLNNLTVKTYEDGKITPNDKEKIIQQLIDSTTNTSTIKIIKKVANCTDDDIKGYRTDEKDKPEVHSMAIYRSAHREFKKQGVDITKWPTDFIDDLSFILTLNTETGEIHKQINQRLVPKYDFLNEELIQVILDNRSSFKVTTNNKWHRFSLKTMKLLVPELFQTSKEQMTILHEMGLIKENHQQYKDYKYLPYKNIAENIYNPVVAKSVREALKIVNELLKKYGNFDYIVIEMPRDDNEEDQKKKIKEFQKNNKRQKKTALTEFAKALDKKGNLDDALKNKKIRSKLYLEIRLWYIQQGYCLYSGKYIKPDELINNFGNFEIDHIIPQSVSSDDSINNKTLCYVDMNYHKRKRTPYGMFMDDNNIQGWDQFKARVMKLKKAKFLNKYQVANYLFDGDIEDIETRKRFIARNMVDTRYASRLILNSLQDFFSEKDKLTKVTTIRGKFTSNMRKRWKLTKTRESYHHHAIDASVIAITPFLKLWEKGGTIFPTKVEENTIDIVTGEIYDDDEYDKLLSENRFNGLVDQLMDIDDQVKFSHQVDKKMNRRISNDTIYSVRPAQLGKDKEETDYTVANTGNIYEVAGYEKFKKVYDKDKNKFLMAKIDPRTFAKLEEIMQSFPDKKEKTDKSGKVKLIDASPFAFYKENNGYIRKFSKKTNIDPKQLAPIINLKYYDQKMGAHIDITPENAKNKKVILQSLNPWRTDVYYNSKTNEYEIMGMRYSDLSTVHGKMGITRDKYLEIKKMEKIDDESQFMFSLYRKDRVKLKNLTTDEEIEMLFWSRNFSSKWYAEIKPYDSYACLKTEKIPVYGSVRKEKQILKRLVPKECKIWKVNTDVLGNKFCVEKESEYPKNILDLK